MLYPAILGATRSTTAHTSTMKDTPESQYLQTTHLQAKPRLPKVQEAILLKKCTTTTTLRTLGTPTDLLLQLQEVYNSVT